MLRKGGASGGGQNGGQQPGEGHGPSRNLEVGVAEMSNSICNAMMGLVLTDQSLRDFQAARKVITSPASNIGMDNKAVFGQSSVDVDMGNKQSGCPSEAEDPAEPAAVTRLPPSGRRLKEAGDFTEDGDDAEVAEVPPPMRPISSLPAPDDSSLKKDSHDDWNGLQATEPSSDHTPDNSANCDQQKENSSSAESCDPVAKAIEQRSYRLQEILDSEKMYVSDLEQVYTYIKYMRDSKETEDADIPMPDELRQGRDRMIFGNIESIYEWHRDFFSKNLEKCIENPVELGALFKKYEKKFQMYVVYCQNKPKSEFIVSAHIDTYFEEIRLKYGFKLRLTDLLIKPIQRLTKYHMLLEAILKHSQRAGLMEEAAAIEQAFHVMTVVPNQANDMMDIGRLQGFEGKIVAQGKLLLHGPLLCTDDPSSGPNYKLKEMTVFLFEQIIIFADTVGKKTQFTSPVYTYKAHIQVNKMQFEEKVDGDSENRMFRVKSTCPKGPAITYVCQAEHTKARNMWTGTMSRQLQTQKEFLQALQAPIAYHNKRMKELSETDLNKHWEISSALESSRKDGGSSKQKSVGQLSSDQHLSIEDAFDRALSLPSSPTVKNAEDSFDSFEEEIVRKPRSSSEKTKRPPVERPAASPSSSLGLSRKTFLEGLKIRSRTRSGDNLLGGEQNGVNGVSKSDDKLHTSLNKVDYTGRSESCGLLSPGTVSTVLIDYRAVREDEVSVAKGDQVTIVSSNLTRGYLVHRAGVSHVCPPAEGWIPSYCLHMANNATKKPSAWAFKLRKQSLSMLGRQESGLGRGFVEHLNNVHVTVGEKCVFRCRVGTGVGAGLVWKGPGGGVLQSGEGRIQCHQADDGTVSLTIDQCELGDTGDYYCILVGEEGSVSTCARLTVSRVAGAPGQPKVQDLKGSSAVVTWDRGDTGHDRVFSLQMCRIATGHWQLVRDNIDDGLCIVDSLVQGETYSFRVVSHAPGDAASLVSEPSLPSTPLTVPLSDLSSTVAGVPSSSDHTNIAQLLDPAWRPDFELQYIELEEVGRGRFSVVRRCQEILTGREVAVKFVNRRKQTREQTRREYDLLRKLSHPNIVSASGLFVTVNSDAIVMDIVFGPCLFDWLCESPSYSETSVGQYMVQLLGALAHLHSSKVIHLDLKPENLILEADNQTLRLIDLGEAQSLQLAGVGGNMADHAPETGPEFLPPETISRGPVGTYTDMWGVGVILYTLLTGLSPFLEESDEETINNILRCDYSFSDDNSKVSQSAKDLIRRLLVINPCQRISATSCLSSSWIRTSKISRTLVSSRHLTNTVARRKKRLSNIMSNGPFTRIPRPESMYKKLPS